MNTRDVIEFASELIRFKSTLRCEQEAVSFLTEKLKAMGFAPETLPVDAGRSNIFAACGTPEILFSTHIDVVPALDELFSPRIDGERLIGRGACDAKGIIACMVAAVTSLRARGESDFGMLFVVGEETTGDGARSAAEVLKDRGVRYIINGEPTECRVATAHKGALGLRLVFSGRSCHSGYPELGEDANAKLARTCLKLLGADFGSDTELGKATLNIGLISGGSSSNTVSDKAELRCTIRTVEENSRALEKVRILADEASEINIENDAPLARMLEVPGIERFTASYCTDIPNLAPLGAEFVLYGPGSIFTAHSNNESISMSDIETAVCGYQEIYSFLKARIHRPRGDKN